MKKIFSSDSETDLSRRQAIKSTAGFALLGTALANSAVAGNLLSPGKGGAIAPGNPPLQEVNFKSLPDMTDFNHRVLLSPMRFSLDRFMLTQDFEGLSLSNAFLYGTLWDKEGNLYVIVRCIGPHMTDGFVINYNENGVGPMKLEMSSLPKTFRGHVLYEKSADSVRWYSADYALLGKSTFEYTQKESGATWREADVMSLTGKLCHPNLQWWDPSPRGASAYCTHMHRCSGTLFGKAVEGWYGNDLMFFQSGVSYPYSPLAAGGVEYTWVTIGTEYDDGSWEIGYIAKGAENWSFAIIIDDKGQMSYSTTVHSTMTRSADGYPDHMTFTWFDAATGRREDWDWQTYPNSTGKVAGTFKLLPTYNKFLSGEGLLRRVGDPRKIRYQIGWTDFHAGDRILNLKNEV
jgi:hypothetical protein